MFESPQKIAFQNNQNPQAAFDIVPLEDLFNRKYSDHSPLDLHRVGFYLIIFITQGTGRHTIDFTEYSYKENTIFTIRKDQLHQFSLGKNIKGTMLLFTDDFLVSYLEKLEAEKSLLLFNELLSSPKLQFDTPVALELRNGLSRMSQEYFSTNDSHSLGIIRSELHILITQLFRIKSTQQQGIKNRKYLSEFISLQKLVEDGVYKSRKVSTYADQMALSTKTLNAITQQIIAKSAKEFIDDICTTQLKRLLINTELSVKEVAFAAGFEETTNFYKYFKRQTGLTPEHFRSSN